MPELPEVESARAAVAEHCVGKRIAACECDDDDIVFVGVEPRKFAEAMTGRVLTAAKRKGKHMWWEMDVGPSPLFHFGMTGAVVIPGVERCHYKRFKITSEDIAAWPKRHLKCKFTFADGTELYFVNKRRLGRVRLLDKPLEEPPLSKLGFDPLTDMASLADFRGILAKRSTAIKALLLNQNAIAGIGNWIADEVLYQSGIHPEARASELGGEQVAALHASIEKVIATAVSANARHHLFPRNWLFHYRWSKAADTKARRRKSKSAEGGRKKSKSADVGMKKRAESSSSSESSAKKKRKAAAADFESSSASSDNSESAVRTSSRLAARRSTEQSETASSSTRKSKRLKRSKYFPKENDDDSDSDYKDDGSESDSDESDAPESKSADEVGADSKSAGGAVRDFYGRPVAFLTVGGRTTAVVAHWQKAAGAGARAFVDDAAESAATATEKDKYFSVDSKSSPRKTASESPATKSPQLKRSSSAKKVALRRPTKSPSSTTTKASARAKKSRAGSPSTLPPAAGLSSSPPQGDDAPLVRRSTRTRSAKR